MYEIRKGRITYVSSSVVNCGYTKDQLKSLYEKGYHLYQNGRKIK